MPRVSVMTLHDQAIDRATSVSQLEFISRVISFGAKTQKLKSGLGASGVSEKDDRIFSLVKAFNESLCHFSRRSSFKIGSGGGSQILLGGLE